MCNPVRHCHTTTAEVSTKLSGEIERGFVQKITNGDWALKMCGVTALKEDAEEQHPCRICKDGTFRKIDEKTIFAGMYSISSSFVV